MIPRPLLVLLAMLVPMATPQIAGAQEPTVCQIRSLASLWGTSQEEARAVAVGKLRAGLKSQLFDAEYAAAKLPTTCAWSETPYTYNDAEVLARAWSMSPAEAKTQVESKIAQGLEVSVIELLASGGKGFDEPKKFIGDEFFNSGYAYCDARVLAAAWEMDPYDAKISAAKRILGGDKLELDFKKGTKQMRKRREVCDFWETGWYTGDAELLAQVWGITLDESKARIGRDVAQGRAARLWKQVSRAKLGK
jgi:hypothetical protein